MTRIFAALACFALLLTGANIVLGWSIGALHETASRFVEARRLLTRLENSPSTSAPDLRHAQEASARAAEEFRPIRTRYGWHTLLGIAAGLVTILVNSITVTYFVGTSRWCKEVSEAYQLSPRYAQRSQRLKRRAFPWALASMLVIIGVVALGGASDPAANLRSAHEYVLWHGTSAIAGWLFLAWSFWVQLGNMAANYAVIQEILIEVQRVQQQAAMKSTHPIMPTVRSPASTGES